MFQELTHSDIVTKPLFTPVIQSLNASCPVRELQKVKKNKTKTKLHPVGFRFFCSECPENQNVLNPEPCGSPNLIPTTFTCPFQRRDIVQLMNVTLDIYTRIFSSILQQQPDTILHEVPESKRPEVEAKLQELQRMMEGLRRGLYHKTEDTINYLNKIKVPGEVCF